MAAEVVSFSTATFAVITGVASGAFSCGVTLTLMQSKIKRLEERHQELLQKVTNIETDRNQKITEWRLGEAATNGRFIRLETNLDHILNNIAAIADKLGVIR